MQKQMCKKDCTEENYSLIIINRFNQLENMKQNKAVFRTRSRNLPIFQYTFRAEQSFLIFISNIGGIMSLWFGLSFIDIHIIVRKMLAFIKIFFTEYLLFNHILETLRQTRIFKWFSKILEVLREFFDRLGIKNLKLLIKILCIPCFFYQVIGITVDYLNFSTNVNVEIILVLNENLISMKKIPAVTICHENILREIFFNYDNLVDLNQILQQMFPNDPRLEGKFDMNYTKSKILSIYLSSLKENIPEKCEQISGFLIKYLENSDKIMNNLMTKTLPLNEELEFFSNHFKCYLGINQTMNCSEISEIVSSFSYLGKCNTFLFKSDKIFGFENELQIKKMRRI
jgi:hypothetical protein